MSPQAKLTVQRPPSPVVSLGCGGVTLWLFSFVHKISFLSSPLCSLPRKRPGRRDPHEGQLGHRCWEDESLLPTPPAPCATQWGHRAGTEATGRPVCSGCEGAPRGNNGPSTSASITLSWRLTHMQGGLSFRKGWNVTLSKGASGPVKFAVDQFHPPPLPPPPSPAAGPSLAPSLRPAKAGRAASPPAPGDHSPV